MTETIHVAGKPVSTDRYGKAYRYHQRTIKRVVKNKRQCALYCTEVGQILYRGHLLTVYKDLDGYGNEVFKSSALFFQDIKDRRHRLKG